MCGIAGLLLPQSRTPNLETIAALQKALAHRGPDEAGQKVMGSNALVHTRLSIIDVAGGHQPLEGPNQTTLILNGEIYNYRELTKAFGDYPFKTHSDSETVLPLYQAYGGRDFTSHLRGMYAFCLVDEAQNKAFLCRDPYGIKPLYYVMLEGGGLAFASEAGALTQSGLAKALINPKVRAQALQLGFSLGDETALGFIKRVLPGQTLEIQDGKIIAQYRQTLPLFAPQKRPQGSLIKEMEDVLRQSVEMHLRSDVPYGLFLSGGLDSATLLKFMSEASHSPVRTYTIGFSGTKMHDERNQAQRLATHFKTDHHAIDFTQEDFWKMLPLVAQSCDDLIFDQAMLPTFKLAAFAAQDLKVVLSGEGGDELFGGYRRYQKAQLPWFLRGKKPRSKGFIDRTKVPSHNLEDWRDLLSLREEELSKTTMSRLSVAQYLDQETWLPHNLLIKLDRCLMAHGLEGRTPFLDPQVGAFCASLPDDVRVRGRFGKWILRQWLQEALPISAPFAKKRGFRVPVGEWIGAKGHRLGTLVARQEGVREIMQAHDVKELFMQKNERALFACWELLFYALWHQIHIQGRPVVPDTLAMLARA
jgi:asparagine synthase (glutamine-hydrolysing)